MSDAGAQATFSTQSPVSSTVAADFDIKANDPRILETDGGRFNRSVRISGAGDLIFEPIDSSGDITIAVLDGEYVPIQMRTIRATSTMTSVVVLY